MKLWGLLIGALAIAGCGSADDTKGIFGAKVCVPGATAECACPGGVKGAQACRDDGSGYEACQCGGGSGSGGGAGAGQAGSGGAGGAGGSCTPRMACPETADGGAQICGMLDDYCGGKLSCGCEFGGCSGGGCECARAAQYDEPCGRRYMRPIAMSCSATAAVPAECHRASGPLNGADGPGFPANTFCCAH